MFAQRTVADNFADKLPATTRKFSTSLNEILESFEGDQATDAQDTRHSILARGNRNREIIQINSVVNAMNFCGEIGTTSLEQITTVIGLGGNEFGGGANLVQQFVIAQISHKILAMSGKAKRDARNFLNKKRSVRGAVGKMDMEMIHGLAGEKIGKPESVARAQLGFVDGSVLLPVKIDKGRRPATVRFGFLFPDLQNSLRRSVTDRGAQALYVFVAQAGEGRIDGADFKLPPKPLQLQHLPVAKRLGDDRVA